MVTLSLGPEDVVATRFAFSPMWEVLMSYRVLQNPSQHSLYVQWVHEAQRALSGLDLRYMDALIGPSATTYVPDFLTPHPQGPPSLFKDELDALRETPPEVVVRNVHTLMDWHHAQSEVISHYLEAPAEALARLVETVAAYWDRTLAPHWPKIKAVLEGDVLYRSRQLALQGPDGLFNNLHTLITYREEMLYVRKHFDADVDPQGGGLTLVPVLFSWPELYLIIAEPRQPTIGYSPRGAGLWNSRVVPPSEALTELMGATRASILMALEVPTATEEIARKLNRTPGAISQQLKRLKKAGLVESYRKGYYVYYRRTHRSDQLIELFSSR